jgi:hypothetical protein
MLRAFFFSQEHLFWCWKAQSHYPPRPSPIHGSNPKECAKPGSGHQAVLMHTNLVRCCSAFAHTSTSPTRLDSRCFTLGCEPEASHNGQAIGASQAAAPIHRIHHSNEHPVGCTAAPILAAFGYLYQLLVRSSAYTIYHHRTRARVINYWRQGADGLTLPLPTTPSERTRKTRPEPPEHATRSQ